MIFPWSAASMPGKYSLQQCNQRGHVEIHHIELFVERGLNELSVHSKPGIVHEYINAGNCGENLVGRFGLRKVLREDLDSYELELQSDLLQPPAIAGHQHQLIALAGEDAGQARDRYRS